MIYLDLFLTFFKIGLFTFGGGYAMIPLVLENVTEKGWMTADLFYELLGICESTPGPIAINMATFVGSDQGGILGSACATLGVVLPSFVIILVIAALFKNFAENRFVKSAFVGMRPVIVGLIGSTGIILALGNVFPNIHSFEFVNVDWFLLILTTVLFVLRYLWKKFRKKVISPILLIAISAVVGMIFG
ncbi:MAG: chromate transporter [Ruminococcaceae bacterium]|nr:chromate transporter [Oscillospiraceae bacterium]